MRETLLARQVMFFANMGAILSYGLLGTLVTFFFISVGVSSAFQIMNFDNLYDEGPSLRDTLTLGATFCATDSIAILQILSQVWRILWGRVGRIVPLSLHCL